MRYELFDFQKKAKNELLTKMMKMQKHYHEDSELSSVLLTAPTGAGKTVISAAVAEGLFFGNDIMSNDPHAVILWVSDNPPLNVQTKHRFAVAADAINEQTDMVIIDETFAVSARKLEPHHVYFLNRQKLSSRARLANSAEGGRTFYDVLTDTIEDENIDLFLMIDEAHLGLGKGEDKGTSDGENKTIYAKLIDGQPGLNPPMPVVVGITATPKRFNEAMAGRANRTTVPNVTVSNQEVRDQGIIKDIIELRSPRDSQNAIHKDLQQACNKLDEMSRHWEAYREANKEENIPPIDPLLVVQTEDRITDDALAKICQEIRYYLPNLDTDSFANCFGEHENRDNDFAKVPYASPDEVQENHAIRVLFAKDAISTGWDCPRAEVLYSRRKRTDKDYIHQMLGRMVRTPLARRIESDDLLNVVFCYLPEYDAASVHAVAELIRTDHDLGDTSHVRTNAVTAGWYSHSKQEIQQLIKVADNLEEAEKIAVKMEAVDELPLGVELHNTLFDLDDQAGETGTELTQPKLPSTPRVKIDKPVVAQIVKNMPSTTSVDEDEAIKQSFAGIITRNVQENQTDKFAVLFNAINILTSITDPEGNPWEDDAKLQEEFCDQIEGAIRKYPAEFARDLHSVEYRKQMVVKVDVLGKEVIGDNGNQPDEEVEIDSYRLNSIYDEVCRRLGNTDYVKAYCKKMNPEGSSAQDIEVVKRLGGVISCLSVFNDLERWAEEKTKELIAKHDPNKGRMTEEQQQKWNNDVVGNTNPWVEKHLSIPSRSSDQNTDNKGYRKHVITGPDGLAHLHLSPMEDNVVENEIKSPYNIAWYRNESRNLNHSLSIPWLKNGVLTNMYPDFIFFEKNNSGKIIRNIIDPHGDWLADAAPKLKGYVEYLKDHGNDFARVLAVADVTRTEYRYLDLKDPKVVAKIEGCKDNDAVALFSDPSISHVYMTVKE